MAETVALNGVNYTIPDPGDQPNWGTGLTPYLVAVGATIASSPSFMQPVSVASTPTTMVSGKTYLVTTSSIAITLNLPAPATNMWMIVHDVSGSAATHNITIHRPGSQAIDGTAADKILSRNFGTWILCSDGTNYFTLNEFPDSGLVNSDIASAAAIAYSKLLLTGSIVNADIATGAAIAYAKLNLTGAVINADISASAAIAYSKLALTGSIVNADIGASAAIAYSKLASLTSAHILVGNGSNVPADVAVSGDVALANTGAITLVNASVTGQALTSLSATLGTITTSDTILGALGKIVNARIVQIVQNTSSGLGSGTSASFGNTGLSVTIVPKSSSNKILVLVSTSGGSQTQTDPAYYTIARGSTNLGGTLGLAIVNVATGGQIQTPLSLAYLDSPATTSSTTYNLQFQSDGTHTIFYGNANQTSVMIAIEIGA